MLEQHLHVTEVVVLHQIKYHSPFDEVDHNIFVVIAALVLQDFPILETLIPIGMHRQYIHMEGSAINKVINLIHHFIRLVLRKKIMYFDK